ncbi:hypothetical protein GY21_03245 [Cryobacterium roopkundense]|uniref:Uncharacterized protein n=1 Tax=Cryobacterium roopkundense TaxID=1001240 RepID=A0A099JNC1_9MICO|nr:hypothetical protein GY21_03245 [Cryobacterium roopkundense]MBB5643052.1 hypothetical protein [Cryobacterium roopkundense]
MHSLNSENTGRYLVTTGSGSVYLIDLDRSVMSRVPAMDMTADRSLRRDGQPVDIISLVQCSVGRPMNLIIDLHVPGVMRTTRRTTEVRAIEPFPGAESPTTEDV